MGYEIPQDYNEVQSRILEFREKHPTGSLRSDDPIWVRDSKGEIIGVTMRTHAYRTPDDLAPGQGTAYEPFPGKTPYTKGSEVQNAESSAWGRALIAVGAADARKGITSAQEVNNRKADNAVDDKRSEVIKLLKSKEVGADKLKEFFSRQDWGVDGLSRCDDEQLDAVKVWVHTL